MFALKSLLFFILFLGVSPVVLAQPAREVETQNHFWWSINSQPRISNQWSIVADVHIRRTDFLRNNSFYFMRLGAMYHITPQFSVAGGGGHLWLANRSGATELFSNENRVYQQLQLAQSVGKIRLLQRLRVEERWQQRVVNFLPTTDFRYSTRYRYLLSLTMPVSKSKKVPSLVLADELLLQSGKAIMYNPFDQNRLFAGIRQQLTASLSFDFGYMLVYQQRLSGDQYSRNHTIRWFFYWQPDFRKKAPLPAAAPVLPTDL